MTERQREILKLLDYDTSQADKIKAFNMAMEEKDFSFLIMPLEFYKSWDFCANILFFLTDEQILPLIPKMFDWIEDLNNIGAEKIELRLLETNPKCLLEPIEKVILKNYISKNYGAIKQLYRFIGISALANKFGDETLKIISELKIPSSRTV